MNSDTNSTFPQQRYPAAADGCRQRYPAPGVIVTGNVTHLAAGDGLRKRYPAPVDGYRQRYPAAGDRCQALQDPGYP